MFLLITTISLVAHVITSDIFHAKLTDKLHEPAEIHNHPLLTFPLIIYAILPQMHMQ